MGPRGAIVVDSSTHDVVTNIPVAAVNALAFNPFNNYMYIGGGTGIYLIDSSTNTVVDTLRLSCRDAQSGCVTSLAYNSNNNYMYAGVIPNSLYQIDSSTNSVVDIIDVGKTPSSIAYNPFNKYMYVAQVGSNSILVIAPDDSIEPPTNTAIISAVDGLDRPVQNESSTASTSITFSIEATAGTNPIDGFECSLDGGQFSKCANSNPTTITYRDLNADMQHEFKVVALDSEGNKDPMGAKFIWTIAESPRSQPVADAGNDQLVKSNDIVELDGSNSSDPNSSSLVYSWAQTSGREVSLSDPSSSNPRFTAPEVNEQTDIAFQLTVTNENGIRSDPDEVIVTISPLSTSPPAEEPRTIGDIIKGIIKTPLDVTNSIGSANEIKDILTDTNRDNDKIVCDLIDSEDDYASNIRDLLNC